MALNPILFHRDHIRSSQVSGGHTDDVKPIFLEIHRRCGALIDSLQQEESNSLVLVLRGNCQYSLIASPI